MKVKFLNIMIMAIVLVGFAYSGEFALSAKLLTSAGAKIGYYSKSESSSFYNGAAITLDFVTIQPEYYRAYQGRDTLSLSVDAAEYGFCWELGYQKKINLNQRFRIGAIASISMLDGTDPGDLSSYEQFEYERNMIKIGPVINYTYFPFKTEKKDYLGLVTGVELPAIVSSMDMMFPGVDRVQVKLFAGLVY